MKLDVKDIKILQELDLNPKITTSQLGKRIRLSQQVVDYRIKRLQENNIITNFGTIINLAKLGYEQYRILFQLANVNDEIKKKIIDYLKDHENVYWAAIVGGKWDLFIVVWVKNYEYLENFLDELFNKFPKSLKDYEALYTINHEFYRHNYLFNKKQSFNVIKIDTATAKSTIELDKIDFCILNNIKSKCRKSSLEIGNLCNVSYKTIQNRIRNMEQKEIISGYRIFLKSKEYKPYLLLIYFSEYGRETEKRLLSYARSHKDITQTTKIFGRWSLLFHIRAINEKELQNLVIEMRNNYPIIGDYEIIPIFEDISINHFPMSKENLSK